MEVDHKKYIVSIILPHLLNDCICDVIKNKGKKSTANDNSQVDYTRCVIKRVKNIEDKETPRRRGFQYIR